MPRKKRIRKPNTTYHVYSRSVQWEYLMKEDRFKDLFVDLIQKTQEKYVFQLNFYEIMGNHFHLVIKTVEGGADISRIMQYLKSRFAQRFNRLTGRIGPFWNERFKDIIVEEQDNPVNYLLWLLWYLAFNPIRKNIVSDPMDYRYGCINSYLSSRKRTKLTITLHEYFLQLGGTFRERVKRFLYYEEAYRRRHAIIW